MDPAGKLFLQHLVDLAVALNQAFARESFGDGHHPEMRLARVPAKMIARPGVARVFGEPFSTTRFKGANAFVSFSRIVSSTVMPSPEAASVPSYPRMQISTQKASTYL